MNPCVNERSAAGAKSDTGETLFAMFSGLGRFLPNSEVFGQSCPARSLRLSRRFLHRNPHQPGDLIGARTAGPGLRGMRTSLPSCASRAPQSKTPEPRVRRPLPRPHASLRECARSRKESAPLVTILLPVYRCARRSARWRAVQAGWTDLAADRGPGRRRRLDGRLGTALARPFGARVRLIHVGQSRRSPSASQSSVCAWRRAAFMYLQASSDDLLAPTAIENPVAAFARYRRGCRIFADGQSRVDRHRRTVPAPGARAPLSGLARPDPIHDTSYSHFRCRTVMMPHAGACWPCHRSRKTCSAPSDWRCWPSLGIRKSQGGSASVP